MQLLVSNQGRRVSRIHRPFSSRIIIHIVIFSFVELIPRHVDRVMILDRAYGICPGSSSPTRGYAVIVQDLCLLVRLQVIYLGMKSKSSTAHLTKTWIQNLVSLLSLGSCQFSSIPKVLTIFQIQDCLISRCGKPSKRTQHSNGS